MTDQDLMYWYHNSKGIEKEIIADWLYDHSRYKESNIVRAIGRIEQGKNVKNKLNFWCKNHKTNFMIPEEVCNLRSISACVNNAIALKCDGTVINWFIYNGRKNSEEIVSNFKNIIQIWCKYDLDYFVLNSSGTLIRYNEEKIKIKLHNVSKLLNHYGWQNVDFALRGNRVFSFDYDGRYQATGLDGMDGYIDFSFGVDHHVGLRKDGTIYGYGHRSDDYGGNLTDIVQISCGSNHTLFLKSNGTVLSSREDVPKYIKNVIKVSANSKASYVLKIDGSIDSWGIENKQHDMFENVIEMSHGYNHNFAITLDEEY